MDDQSTTTAADPAPQQPEPKRPEWPDAYLHRGQHERLKSLQQAKLLLSGEPATSIITRGDQPAPNLVDMIRLGHYIVTGRDYADRAELDKDENA